MKAKFLLFFALSAVFFAACDDTTEFVGGSLTDRYDNLDISTDTFQVTTRSVVMGSVISRNTTGYLGTIRDQETNAIVTGNFMTQFHTLENYHFPEKSQILSLDDMGNVEADSCSIRLFYSSYYGDSLATQKLTAYEMARPMEDGDVYYTSFNPEDEGFIKQGGIQVNKTYTLQDETLGEAERNASDFTPNIKINLNEPYFKDGVKYSNYGTYIMRKYYERADNFSNSYNFVHNVCPGFYFKMQDGLGAMAYVNISQLNVYFKYKDKDTILLGASSFAGTEEVLQTTYMSSDKETLQRLADDETCTYVKSPAGIYTEMTLPVDQIIRGHERDTINIAKVDLQRINNDVEGKYRLPAPTTLLMIPKDSINTFFEQNKIADYKTSFLATYSASSASSTKKYNNYTFNNISGIIRYMAEMRDLGVQKDRNWLSTHPDWNKVAIIPVKTTYSSVSGGTSNSVVKIEHDMGMTSAKLVGGSRSGMKPITLSIVYSKFKH